MGVGLREPDHAGNGDVAQRDVVREHHKGDEQVGEEKAAGRYRQVLEPRADATGGLHPALRRRRAANAPSAPWRWGITRSIPASIVDSGTVPAGGGSN